MIDWTKLVMPADKLAKMKADAISQVRHLRSGMFPILAGMQAEALARGDASDALAIANIQQSLRDLPAVDLSACTDQASIDAAFKSQWLSIVSTAPISVRSAFAAVL